MQQSGKICVNFGMQYILLYWNLIHTAYECLVVSLTSTDAVLYDVQQLYLYPVFNLDCIILSIEMNVYGDPNTWTLNRWNHNLSCTVYDRTVCKVLRSLGLLLSPTSTSMFLFRVYHALYDFCDGDPWRIYFTGEWVVKAWRHVIVFYWHSYVYDW